MEKSSAATITAISPLVRQSVRKLRLVSRAIRHLTPQKAMDVLSMMPQAAASPIRQTIRQAVANATNNSGFAEQAFDGMRIELREGPTMKRSRIGGRGRVKPILKRTSRVVVKLFVNRERNNE